MPDDRPDHERSAGTGDGEEPVIVGVRLRRVIVVTPGPSATDPDQVHAPRA